MLWVVYYTYIMISDCAKKNNDCVDACAEETDVWWSGSAVAILMNRIELTQQSKWVLIMQISFCSRCTHFFVENTAF